jgi:hypothetical protein
MQNDKIAGSQIPNKSNVERWSKKKITITQKDLKNKGENKKIIKGQTKIFN